MKRIEIKDLKEGRYWLKDRNDDSFNPVRVYTGATGHFYYLMLGNECEEHVRDEDQFFELITPVVGQTELFSKTYDGESIVDLERDISEAFLDNPAMEVVPVDEYNIHYGAFKVTMTWVPENDNS